MRIQELGKRLDDPALGLDLLRMYLGAALFVRGATFVAEPDALTTYMERTGTWFVPVMLSHYIIGAHIAGGIMLLLGIGTRVAALVQAPILAGAVFFVHWGEGLLSNGQSLELSGLVLVMLVVIGTCGPGKFSLDHYLEHRTFPEPPTSQRSGTALDGKHEAPAHS
jgi:putative oxidoreductase